MLLNFAKKLRLDQTKVTTTEGTPGFGTLCTALR